MLLELLDDGRCLKLKVLAPRKLGKLYVTARNPYRLFS